MSDSQVQKISHATHFSLLLLGYALPPIWSRSESSPLPEAQTRSGFRPEPCRQGVAELPLCFSVCVLRRGDPRDVAVRTNQKGISRGGLLFASGHYHINSIAPTGCGVA